MASSTAGGRVRRASKKYQYDVCLSFAGEDRLYVSKVAEVLRENGIRVFYDNYERVKLWGKDLYAHLSDIYGNAARYCVLFISKHYARKLWSNHERSAAQDRAFREHHEYILPARFDDTRVPGLLRTIGYVNLRTTKPKELAKLIVEKVGTPPRSEYLPPVPDLLFKSYKDEFGDADLEEVYNTAAQFLETLQRTNAPERNAIVYLFMEGCTAAMPENIHINLNLLARLTGSTEAKLVRLFAGLRSLGFYSRVSNRGKDKRHIGQDRILSVEWHDMRIDSELSPERNATAVAWHMMNIKDFAHCEECAAAGLRRLDFSHLSTLLLNKEALDLQSGRRIRIGQELRKLHGIALESSESEKHTRHRAHTPANPSRKTATSERNQTRKQR